MYSHSRGLKILELSKKEKATVMTKGNLFLFLLEGVPEFIEITV